MLTRISQLASFFILCQKVYGLFTYVYEAHSCCYYCFVASSSITKSADYRSSFSSSRCLRVHGSGRERVMIIQLWKCRVEDTWELIKTGADVNVTWSLSSTVSQMLFGSLAFAVAPHNTGLYWWKWTTWIPTGFFLSVQIFIVFWSDIFLSSVHSSLHHHRCFTFSQTAASYVQRTFHNFWLLYFSFTFCVDFCILHCLAGGSL